MNERVIVNIIVLTGALILALFLGSWVVSDPEGVGVGIVVTGALIVFVAMNRHLWMLIPPSMVAGIKFPLIPGGFTLLELVAMYVVCSSFILLLSKKVSLKLRFTSLEWFSLAILLLLFQAYLRNPVGIRALGSDNIGGRPYVIVFIGVSAGWVLASTRTTHQQIRKAFHWSLFVYLGSFCLNLVAKISVAAAKYTTILFGVTGGHSLDGGPGEAQKDTRIADRNSTASLLARASSRFLVAYINPLKALYKPFWLFVLVIALVAAGLSGYRSVIAVTAITLMLGAYYWGKTRSVILAGILALSGYICIVVINIAVPLPPNIQRSLSFIPGSWEERHLDDADASTDWRVVMWEEALLTDRYINNKYIGDGLGIERSDFLHIQAISEAPVITDEMSQLRAMLAGDFHSGPVTTVKVVGYAGLIVVIIAMFVVAWRAHRLILNSKGESYFSAVIFFCLPMVFSPIVYLFIFGDFKTSIPIWFIQVGLLRLLENNLTRSLVSNDNNGAAEINA